jgi:hypothetical protein
MIQPSQRPYHVYAGNAQRMLAAVGFDDYSYAEDWELENEKDTNLDSGYSDAAESDTEYWDRLHNTEEYSSDELEG